MIISASVRNTKRIEVADFETARQLVEKNETFLHDLIIGLSLTDEGKVRDKVAKVIRKNSPIRRSILLNRTGGYVANSMQLNIILQTLIEQEVIIREAGAHGGAFYIYTKDRSPEEIVSEVDALRKGS